MSVEVFLLHAQDERQDALLLRTHQGGEVLNGGRRRLCEEFEPEQHALPLLVGFVQVKERTLDALGRRQRGCASSLVAMATCANRLGKKDEFALYARRATEVAPSSLAAWATLTRAEIGRKVEELAHEESRALRDAAATRRTNASSMNPRSSIPSGMRSSDLKM